MAKPDPALLDPSHYPFVCRIDPRFGDLDVNMHINNVAMASMLEDARVRFHRAAGYSSELSGLRSVMASISIEYLAEGLYPEPVDVHVALESHGRTSHSLVQVARQGPRILAFARTVQVTVGPDGPTPVPDKFVETARAWSLAA